MSATSLRAAPASRSRLPGGRVDPAPQTFPPFVPGAILHADDLNAALEGGADPGDLLKLVSSGGANLPTVAPTQRLLFRRTATASTDFADFEFDRTTAFTDGSGLINRAVGINFTVGADVLSAEHGLIINGRVNCTNSGLTPSHYGLWSQMQRSAGAKGHCTGMVSNVVDETGLGTLDGDIHNLLGIECDVYANGLDDQPNPATYGGIGVRRAVSLSVGLGVDTADPVQFSCGLHFATLPNSEISQLIGISPTTRTVVGLDMRGAFIPNDMTGTPVCAVKMSPGQIIDFNGGTELRDPPGNYLQYTGGHLHYMADTTEIVSFSDDATMGLGITASSTQKIRLGGAASVGLNTSDAALTGAAIRLATDQYIGFTAADSRQLSYTASGTPRLTYQTSTGVELLSITDVGAVTMARGLAAFGGTPPAAKPAVAGSRGGNAALAALLTVLESYGFITDNTVA